MARKPEFSLQISIVDTEEICPVSIVKSPRTFRPQDLAFACANLSFAGKEKVPKSLLAIVQFVVSGYFQLAHTSGLYNRQIKLWESIAKIKSVEIYQQEQGLFLKSKKPEYHIVFLDHKKRPVVLAYHVNSFESSSAYLKGFKDFIRQIGQAQVLEGLFVSCPRPFPAPALEYVRKETRSKDKIASYESIFPKFGIPMNLLELESSPIISDDNTETYPVHLILPDLSKRKLGPDSPVTFQSSNLAQLSGKQEQNESQSDQG